MQAVQKDLMGMLLRELKEELEARDQPKMTGNKAWLRRRLHSTIVRARASCRAIIEWTLLPFCDMGQTFTISFVTCKQGSTPLNHALNGPRPVLRHERICSIAT
jgi:hypothetical protein